MKPEPFVPEMDTPGWRRATLSSGWRVDDGSTGRPTLPTKSRRRGGSPPRCLHRAAARPEPRDAQTATMTAPTRRVISPAVELVRPCSQPVLSASTHKPSPDCDTALGWPGLWSR
ncbi:MAG: hypothetical protein ACPIOQ_39065, partial [Promethearchaeia archaeon]